MRSLTIMLVMSVLIALLTSCTAGSGSGEERYVVLSPEVAELLCAIGAGESIVGTTAECDYPPELAGREIVGNFGALNREAILRLNPSLIFSSGLEQEAIAADFGKLGYAVHSFYPQSLEELIAALRELGKLVDRRDEAELLADSLSVFITAQKALNEGRKRPKVYLEIYRDPLMSVSDESLVGELIELAGGDNVFDRLERDYARIDPERLIGLAPDIMICYSQDSLDAILARKGWQDIPALKNRMIFFEKDIDPDLIQRAGPRFREGVKRLREIFAVWEAAQ